MRRLTTFRDFDWVLMTLTLIICGFGVMQIYSATMQTKFAGLHVKQMYWIAGGLALMLLISRIDYHQLLEQVHWIYLVFIGLLVAVLIVGVRIFGAQSWIKLPGLGMFQPSEWMKLILILAVARYFSSLPQREVTAGDIIKGGLIVGVPALLVLKQPDLGTTLTYVPVLLMALFLSGMKARHTAVLLLIGALAMPAAWYKLKPYQKARLTAFLNPTEDPQGSGYQTQQSLIAVGAGGIWGAGTAQGTQTQGMFLPVTHTDFIFAAWAEEHGFVGAITLLLLYFMVLMRLIHNAQTAPDRAGAFVVMGVVAALAFHILVNVGMVLGLMPITGIPLPLLSYGGSSTLFMFLALGVVMNVRMRRFVN